MVEIWLTLECGRIRATLNSAGIRAAITPFPPFPGEMRLFPSPLQSNGKTDLPAVIWEVRQVRTKTGPI
jgi:hypothetical protein